MLVRTRFAPSPTGYLHIGSLRTALFSWAFARKHKGTFILRIEDTDLERSTAESVQAIFAGLKWLGLDYDEGPFYQTARMPRYQAVIQQLLANGQAYYCYASIEELEALRETQRLAGLKPRYDGRWRDAKLAPPIGVKPVVRFKNPLTGSVVFEDKVKGRIEIQNSELDDLIIARSDGTPTYNFCVVVDDWDMAITHVIRGDDHVNNTPRQINILQALGAPIPEYAHAPMILGHDGERLSKRHGSVDIMQYQAEGFLPDALVNYLARLGWGHGDAEIFSRDQFVEWFDLDAISHAPARFDGQKLTWLNQAYLKQQPDGVLAEAVTPFLQARVCQDLSSPSLSQVVALLKERASTLLELADAAVYFYRTVEPPLDVLESQLTAEVHGAITALLEGFSHLSWNREAIHAAIKQQVQSSGLKFPQLAMPLRIMVTGQAQTPSIDAVLELFGKEATLTRLHHQLARLS